MADLDPNRGRETFVGRSRELAEICAGIDGAVAGSGAVFTLAGEPGVGKSRLAQEAKGPTAMAPRALTRMRSGARRAISYATRRLLGSSSVPSKTSGPIRSPATM